MCYHFSYVSWQVNWDIKNLFKFYYKNQLSMALCLRWLLKTSPCLLKLTIPHHFSIGTRTGPPEANGSFTFDCNGNRLRPNIRPVFHVLKITSDQFIENVDTGIYLFPIEAVYIKKATFRKKIAAKLLTHHTFHNRDPVKMEIHTKCSQLFCLIYGYRGGSCNNLCSFIRKSPTGRSTEC